MQPWLAMNCNDLLVRQDAYAYHDHEFYEVFWIEDGVAGHDRAGVIESITPHTLVFVRPGDVHRFSGPEGSRVRTIMLRSTMIADAAQRYASEHPAWPWPEDGPPRRVPTTPAILEELRGAVARAMRTRRRADADSVLLCLLAVAAEDPPPRSAPAPVWLEEAIAALRYSPLLQGGVAALVHLCGRSTTHVERTVRQHFGSTPIKIVTQLRMERAAKLIRHRGMAIRDAAREVGMPNMGNFSARFKAHFGMTPSAFRYSP